MDIPYTGNYTHTYNINILAKIQWNNLRILHMLTYDWTSSYSKSYEFQIRRISQGQDTYILIKRWT